MGAPKGNTNATGSRRSEETRAKLSLAKMGNKNRAGKVKELPVGIEEKIAKYALEGCQTETISTLVGVQVDTLRRRFGTLLKEKRAEHKYNLHVKQNELATKYPAMAIFLGKNFLDQKDKKELDLNDKSLAKALSEMDKKNGQGQTKS